METMADLGEFRFIDRIAPLLPSSPTVIEGIGDDCAVLQVGDRRLLVSCDLFLEDVHFRRANTAPEDIGWKAAAAALSDIAAMGGLPLFLLISLAAPADTGANLLESIYKGIAAAAASCNAAIVGGDTTRSAQGIVIDVIVLGEPSCLKYLTRSGAANGDLLVVTGRLGRSAAGLHAREQGHTATGLIASHDRPAPRIREAQWLCAHPAVHALIDVSDGLVQDAAHIARASSLGIEIKASQLPADDELERYCEAQDIDANRLKLSGGEDYGLLFALESEGSEGLLEAFRSEFREGATVVGRCTTDTDKVLVDGSEYAAGGFDHFS